MKAKLQTLAALAQRNAARLTAAGATAMMVAGAHAQSTGIDAVFDAINLDGIATKVAALAVIIVGIALVFKGPSLAKRLISKI